MSGCFNYTAAITLFLLIGMHISFVESRNYRKQKRFTREDVCKETVKTSKTVPDCPVDEESVRRRIKETKCENIHDSCSKDPLVYHCVRSENKLIEVCAPRNYISGKCCAQFNEGVGRIVEDYSVSCSECPFHFYSNESILYPTCIESIKSLAAQQTTMQPTVESTSKSISTHEPATETTTNSLTITPPRKKCRSSTGRRKRHINCEDDTATSTVHFSHSVEKNETETENTSDVVDAGVTIMFVTFIVIVITGIGAVFLVFKGILKPIFIKKNHDDKVNSKSSKHRNKPNGNNYVRAADNDPDPASQTKISVMEANATKNSKSGII